MDALGLDQPRAAMATDIPEDMRLAGLVAGQQQRDAEAVMRDGHIGLGQQRRRRDHLGQAAEQPCLLRLEPGRIGIDRGRHLGDRVAMRAFAGHDLAREVELALGRPRLCGHVHERVCAPDVNVRQVVASLSRMGLAGRQGAVTKAA